MGTDQTYEDGVREDMQTLGRQMALLVGCGTVSLIAILGVILVLLLRASRTSRRE